MANRLILNETSYHGKGAIQNIVHEVTSRSFKKALVVTDKDLIKFNVAKKSPPCLMPQACLMRFSMRSKPTRQSM